MVPSHAITINGKVFRLNSIVARPCVRKKNELQKREFTNQ